MGGIWRNKHNSWGPKIKINCAPKPSGIILRVGVTRVRMDTMLLGIAYISSDFAKKETRPVRCVLWRMNGFPRYVLIGQERGKIIPVLRNFRRVRELTKKEQEKVIGYIEAREELGL